MSNFFKTKPVVRASVLPFLLLAASTGFATTDDDPLSVHGFVNVGVSMADEEEAADVSGGVSDDANYQAHQSFGLQVGYKLDDKTDISAQMLGRAYQDNMNVRMNWAYVGRTLLQDKGAMTDLKLRMGRAPADIYMISEYYDVGYAYPWVIPPREAYDLLGGVPYDGIDLAATFSLPADWSMQLKGYVGQVNVEAKAGQERFDLNDILGFNMIFERDAWRLRAGYGQASVKYEVCCGDVAGFDTLSGGFNETEQGLALLEANIVANVNPGFTPSGYVSTPITDTSDDLTGSFSGVGFSYDDGNLLVMSEYMFQKWDTYNPDMDLAYMTVGKRFGDWMPYITASQAKVADDDDAQALLDKVTEMQAAMAAVQADVGVAGTLAFLPTAQGNLTTAETNFAATPNGDNLAAVVVAQETVDQITALQDGINSLNAALVGLQGGFEGLNLPQKTLSVGVRYDFAPGVTGKVQVDKISGFEDTRGDLEDTIVTHLAIQAAF